MEAEYRDEGHRAEAEHGSTGDISTKLVHCKSTTKSNQFNFDPFPSFVCQSLSGRKMKRSSALVTSVLLLLIGHGASGVNHERPSIVQTTGVGEFKSSFMAVNY